MQKPQYMLRVIDEVKSFAEKCKEESESDEFYFDPIRNPAYEIESFDISLYEKNLKLAEDLTKKMRTNYAPVFGAFFDEERYKYYLNAIHGKCKEERFKELEEAGVYDAETRENINYLFSLNDNHGLPHCKKVAAKAGTIFDVLTEKKPGFFGYEKKDIMNGGLLHDCARHIVGEDVFEEKDNITYYMTHAKVGHEMWINGLMEYYTKHRIIDETSASLIGNTILLHSKSAEEIYKSAPAGEKLAILLIKEADETDRKGYLGLETSLKHAILKEGGKNRIEKWPLNIFVSLIKRRQNANKSVKNSMFFGEAEKKLDTTDDREFYYIGKFNSLALKKPPSLYLPQYSLTPQDVKGWWVKTDD